MAAAFNRFPSKANCLAHISAFTGHDIKTIVDVGILYSTPELITAFPNQKHVLIEPVEVFNDTIVANYSGLDYELLNVAMSSEKGRLNLELRNHLPNSPHGAKYNVTASNLIFDGDLKENKNYVEVETDTLDNICQSYEGPFLVKIDVDGAELEILKGADSCLDDVYWFVVEVWLSRIGEITRILNEKNFQLWDIVDLAYMRGQLSQVDLVFVNKRIMNNEKYKEVSPRSFAFESSGAGNYVALKESGLTPEILERLQQVSKGGAV